MGHHIILAHARAYRAYETSFKPTQNGISTLEKNLKSSSLLKNPRFYFAGKVGITLNINWYDQRRPIRKYWSGRKGIAISWRLDCQSHLRHWRLSRRHETKSLHTYVYHKFSKKNFFIPLYRSAIRAHNKDLINRDYRNSRLNKRFWYKAVQIFLDLTIIPVTWPLIRFKIYQ